MTEKPDPDPDLVVGSLVEVLGNPTVYGVIRWIGTVPDQKDPQKKIAGLEMVTIDTYSPRCIYMVCYALCVLVYRYMCKHISVCVILFSNPLVYYNIKT